MAPSVGKQRLDFVIWAGSIYITIKIVYISNQIASGPRDSKRSNTSSSASSSFVVIWNKKSTLHHAYPSSSKQSESLSPAGAFVATVG
jgi:hypothetical protein